MAITGVIRPVSSHGRDLLMRRDLVQKLRQHGRVADARPGDLDGPYFQRLFIDAKMDLPPLPGAGSPVFAGHPFAFTFNLDPCAVDQEMKRSPLK